MRDGHTLSALCREAAKAGPFAGRPHDVGIFALSESLQGRTLMESLRRWPMLPEGGASWLIERPSVAQPICKTLKCIQVFIRIRVYRH